MEFVKREFLFVIFSILMIGFIINNPDEIKNLYSYISWSTIRALIVLILITTAFKISNVFDDMAINIIKLFKTEKYLALFFITLTAFLSMFLTNDITLFIIVPLTIALNLKNDISKLVFFEAMSANVGSMLTPIGNPQNLYLFREWNISFFDFIHTMFAIFIIKFIILIIFIFILFPNNKLQIINLKSKKRDYFLFFSSLLLFFTFIVALEINFVRFLIPIIILFYLFANIKVLKQFDYFLIITFMLMFIDFSIMAKIPYIKNIIDSINLDFFNTFNLSILLSEVMSNVPATIFISNFSKDYTAISYGVNIAGSSLVLASLANIIAIRMLKNNRYYLTFHKFSIPYFLISYIAIIFYLKIV